MSSSLKTDEGMMVPNSESRGDRRVNSNINTALLPLLAHFCEQVRYSCEKYLF